jgi:hypothetical protein
LTNIETLKLALEALERYAPQHGHPDDMSDAITALRTAIEQANDLERLRDENERLHVENRRLIDRIEVMGVPVGVGGYLTTTTTPPAAQLQDAQPLRGATPWEQLYPQFERATPPAAQPEREQYTALEQALTRLQKRYGELEAKVAAQPAPAQEPVAWAVFEGWNAHDLYLPQEYDEALKMAGYKGDHAKVKPLYAHPPAAQPAPVQVSPTDFVDMVMDKEDAIGKPIFWAEWPNRENNT